MEYLRVKIVYLFNKLSINLNILRLLMPKIDNSLTIMSTDFRLNIVAALEFEF